MYKRNFALYSLIPGPAGSAAVEATATIAKQHNNNLTTATTAIISKESTKAMDD